MSACLDGLERHCLAVTRQLAFAGVLAMLAVELLTTADVLLRWLANKPIHGLNEIVGMSVAVAVAATFPTGAAQRVNLTIELLQDRVGDRIVGWLKVAAAALLLAFYVLLAWRIGVYAATLQARGAETIFVRLPTAPFVWAIATFVTVSALVQVMTVFVSVRAALAGLAGASGWSIGSAADAAPSAERIGRVDGRAVLVAGFLLRRAWAALALLAVVVGAIYTGVCTETEAAAPSSPRSRAAGSRPARCCR